MIFISFYSVQVSPRPASNDNVVFTQLNCIVNRLKSYNQSNLKVPQFNVDKNQTENCKVLLQNVERSEVDNSYSFDSRKFAGPSGFENCVIADLKAHNWLENLKKIAKFTNDEMQDNQLKLVKEALSFCEIV